MLKVSSVSYMHDSNLEKEHIIEVIHPGKLPSVKGGGGGGSLLNCYFYIKLCLLAFDLKISQHCRTSSNLCFSSAIHSFAQ